ncbi:sigma-70 family RNA polymerase sigma factor [Pirellulaceae bacterium SH449]
MDKENLARAKQGDEQALGELLLNVESYLKLLARLQIGRHLQVKLDASDVVQETFLEAHRAIKKFEGESRDQFMAWLRSILASRLSNNARRYLGTQARDVRLEQQIQNDLDHSAMSLGGMFIDPGESPSQLVSQEEQSQIVVACLARLSPDYQNVLVLRHLEGKTFPEIAAQLNRSVDSVEKLWVRGLSKLKKEFTMAIDDESRNS